MKVMDQSSQLKEGLMIIQPTDLLLTAVVNLVSLYNIGARHRVTET